MRISLLLPLCLFFTGMLTTVSGQKVDLEKTILAGARAEGNVYIVSLALGKSATGREFGTEFTIEGCSASEANKATIDGTLVNDVSDFSFECQFPIGTGNRQLSPGNRSFQVKIKARDVAAGTPIAIEQKLEVVRKLPSMAVKVTVNGSRWYHGEDTILVDVKLDKAVSATLTLKEYVGGAWAVVGTTKEAFLRDTPKKVEFKDGGGILKAGALLRLEAAEGDPFPSVLDVSFTVDDAEWKLQQSYAFFIKESGEPAVKGSDKLKNGILYIDKNAEEEIVVYTQAMGKLKMYVNDIKVGEDPSASSAHRFVIPAKLVGELAEQTTRYHKLRFEGTSNDGAKLETTYPLVVNNAPRFLGSSVSIVDERGGDGKTTKWLQVRYSLSRPTRHFLSFPKMGEPNVTTEKTNCDPGEAGELTGCLYTWKFAINNTLKRTDGKQLPLRVDVVNIESGQNVPIGVIGMTSIEMSLTDDKIKEFGTLATQIKTTDENEIKTGAKRAKVKGQLAEVLGFGNEESIQKPDQSEINAALDELINIIRGKKSSSAGDIFGTVLKYAGRFVLSYFGGIKI